MLVNDGFYVCFSSSPVPDRGDDNELQRNMLSGQEFWNWFDPTAWYPLGRPVGRTIYPGLMVTSGIIWNFLRMINMPVDIRNVCVMLAPAFSGLTAWATYL